MKTRNDCKKHVAYSKRIHKNIKQTLNIEVKKKSRLKHFCNDDVTEEDVESELDVRVEWAEDLKGCMTTALEQSSLMTRSTVQAPVILC